MNPLPISLRCRLALIAVAAGLSGRAGTAFAEPAQAVAAATDDDLFARESTLDAERFTRAVLARNPGLESARDAWRASQARHAAADAWPDPMVAYSFAPRSIDSHHARFGQQIELAQRLPAPGARRLATEAAEAGSVAARAELEAARRDLAVRAIDLYLDLYVVARALEINAHHLQLLREIKDSASARYAAGRASQQDPLAAAVELGHMEHDRIMLEGNRRLSIARMNGLLHRPPDAALPPPPAKLPPLPTDEPSSSAVRPELEAMRARLNASEAELGRARTENWPMFELRGGYSTMWDMPEHRLMMGLAVELPLSRARRNGSIDEASAMRSRMEHEVARMRDELNVEAHEAAVRAHEARHTVHVYEQQLIPTSRLQVDAARAGFVAGENDMTALIQAEKNLRTVELELETARADLRRRLAQQARAHGRLPFAAAPGATP